MPSEKLTRVLLSKSPFSKEQIALMTEAEGWKWVYANKEPAKEKGLEICFTGFDEDEKESVHKVGVDAGFTVVGSVTRNLLPLCTGSNPGRVGQPLNLIFGEVEFSGAASLWRWPGL